MSMTKIAENMFKTKQKNKKAACSADSKMNRNVMITGKNRQEIPIVLLWQRTQSIRKCSVERTAIVKSNIG